MKSSGRAFTVLALVTAALGVGAGWAQWKSAPRSQDRLNVLIVSVCSLQYQQLAAYGAKDASIAPLLNDFFARGSVVAERAFTSMGWTSIPTVTGQNLPTAFFERQGYKLRGYREGLQMIRVPATVSKVRLVKGDAVVDIGAEKNYKEMSEYVKNIVRGSYFSPFFLVTHFKYMHFPLVDEINDDAEWDYFLTPEQKKRVAEMREHPERFADKTPLLIYLFSDPKVLASNPYLKEHKIMPKKGEIGRVLGLINHPDLLQGWKKSAGYEEDLAIIEAIYKANFRHFDRVVGPHVQLYDDEKLRDNTVVMVVGDHGEVHMDHDEFTHGTSIFDSILRVPFAIHFPGDDAPSEKIGKQFHLNLVDDIVSEIVSGRMNNREDFKRFVNSRYEPNILARDCSNIWRGLRHDDKYKYMVRTADGEPFLFDLREDPNELKNLAAERPDVVAEMESLYWQNLGPYLGMDPMRCLTWSGDEVLDSAGY